MNTWFAYFNDIIGLVRWMETRHKKPPTRSSGLLGIGGGNALVTVNPEDLPPISSSPVTNEDIDHQKRVLGLAKAFCQQIEGDSSLKRAARLDEILRQDWYPRYEDCHAEWKAFREGIEDDIKERYATYMLQEYAPLVLRIDDEWRVPLSKFAVREEIASAAQCLAVQQPTAAVFHLMRGMEIVVKRIARRFDLPTGPEATWVVLTGNMSDKIATWPKDTDRQKAKRLAWSAAVSNLHHVGRATRNPTMHPAKSYAPKQAKEVYDATRAFMTEVAELLGAAS